MESPNALAFSDLLEKAVNEPGIISAAYRQFHHFSFGNVLLAAVQCDLRKIPFGPLATYPKWKELGRQVRKGEKALMLCQPVTAKSKTLTDEHGEPITFTRFVFRSSWFVLSQTDGADIPSVALPGWDATKALAALDVNEVEFECINGNVMGYARGRAIAVSPLNPLPHKTRFHELAHVLLGHTAEGEQADDEGTPHSLAEVEAESVALVCCQALGLPGAAESRGYIQKWWGRRDRIPEKSAQRILKVADQILRAGREGGGE